MREKVETLRHVLSAVARTIPWLACVVAICHVVAIVRLTKGYAIYLWLFLVPPIVPLALVVYWIGTLDSSPPGRARRALAWMISVSLPLTTVALSGSLPERFGMVENMAVVATAAMFVALFGRGAARWLLPSLLAAGAILLAVGMQNEPNPEFMIGQILLASVLGLHAIVTFLSPSTEVPRTVAEYEAQANP